MEKQKLIFGGVFATHTEMDEYGNVIQRDDFHTRVYWHLWESGAMMKLKGAKLHVLMTIIMHADKRGEGFPSIRRMAEILPYNKDAINKAINELIELDFLERDQKRSGKGTFDHNTYRIKCNVPCPEKVDTEESEENKSVEPCPEKTATEKTGDGKSRLKKDLGFKKDLPKVSKVYDFELAKKTWGMR